MKLLALFLFMVGAAFAQPATAITVNQTRANGGTSGNCLKVNANGTVGQTSGCGGGGGAGTVTSVSGSGPSWLTWNITNPTTTPAITLAPTTGQTSHRVIGTCNAATTFAPCALVSGDLPSSVVFNNAANTGTSAFTLDATAAAASVVKVTTPATGDSSNGAADTAYVANALAAINPAVSVEAATTGVLSNTPTYNNGTAGVGATLSATTAGVLTVDGYSPALNEPILVKNQASSLQNGIYTLTTVGTGGVSYVLTRRTDYNSPTNINYTGTIPVLNGSTNANTGWNLTTQVNVIGTDALTYTQAAAGNSSGPPGGNVKGFGALTNHAVVVGQGGKTIATIGTGTSGQLLKSNGSTADPVFVTSAIATNFIATDETTTSVTFADLTTHDSVTFTCVATCNAAVIYGANEYSSGGTQTLFNSVFVDGVQADDGNQAIVMAGTTAPLAGNAVWLASSLGAGAHTIDIQHKVNGNTGHWRDRMITVFISTP